MSASVVVGLDIGTTSSKAVAWSASRRGGPYAEQPTPWHTSDCGRTETDPYRLVDVAVDLISSAVRAAESAWGPVRVRAIGVTGLAESGVLLDGAGRPAAPGDRLVRSPRRDRARAAGPGGPRIRRGLRRHHGPALVEPGHPGQAALAARQRASGRAGLDLAERARMDRLRPGRRLGARAVAGVPDRPHRPGHRPGLAAGPGGGRAARPDSPRGTHRRQSGRVPAARRCRLLRGGRRPDGGRARPPGGGRRRRRGRGGRAVQLQRYRGRAGPVHPRDAAAGRTPAGRDGGLVARAARAAGHQPAPGRGQRRAAAAARAGGPGGRVRAGPFGARSRRA